ncbi:MAG: hypothetical protein KC503_31770, partial [Myxococcales bacterium]|nr:hypothetical protein [Myxococcales bacterium]
CGGGDAKALLAPGALSDCRARDTPDHLRPLAGLVDALRALRTPRRLAVGVIAADGARIEIVAGASSDVAATSACGAGGADALPSPRLSSFARSFGADGLLLSPCDDTPQLLAGNLAPRLLSRCVDAPVVTETGLACREDDQYGKAKSAVCDDRTLHLARCTVRETSGGSTRDIARCAPPLFYPHDDVPAENDCGADCPCWRLVRDSVACGGVGGSAPPYRLEVLRAGEAPAGTVVDFSCRHATRPWGDDALGDASQICQ